MATNPRVDSSSDLVAEFGENASYVADLLARYRANPDSVDPEWQAFFAERLGEAPRAPEAARPAPEAPTARPAAPVEREGAPAAGAAEGEERTALRGAAARIAQNMEASLEVPTATSQRQIPIKLLDENRRLVNDWRAAHDEGKVSVTHLVAWAIVKALAAFPRLNDAFEGSGGVPTRVQRSRVHLGLAVDVEKGGTRSLLVPNVKDAGAMRFPQFAAAVDDVIDRARRGKLEVRDFEGTTISLTNPGTLGTTASVPRLMPGQGVIVATGAIEHPPAFAGMAPEMLAQLGVSKVVTFTSTYDHRIIQGAESGAFLGRIEELLLGEHGFYEEIFRDLEIPIPPYRWATDQNPALGGDAGTAIVKQARVQELINAYRVRGHLLADTDPLRLKSVEGHPELDLSTYGLTIWDLDREFFTPRLKGGDRMTLREIVAVMRRVYCGKVGVEYRHISDPFEKEWIRNAVGADPVPLAAEARKTLLAKLIAAEAFERFLGTKFLGQRRYSVEGAETAVAFLDRLIEGAAARGVEEVAIGLTHRGRLNILANVVGNSVERIFASFEGSVHPDFPADEGDVKYHQGARAPRKSESGREIWITIPSNPSHLEAVDPVVEGLVRARQDFLEGEREDRWRRILPVLLHGDAAFAGQGIVAEVFNLAQLRGYRTGGTIHVVVNNQIGFTTNPSAGRSSVYSTDVAKITQVPIFHVNADDPEAALRVLEIALDYRQTFHKDVVVDIIGFRLHGHNEGDEPTYTQPLMYQRIQQHPGIKTLYQRRLVKAGVVTAEEVAAMEAAQVAAYEDALARAKRVAAGAKPTQSSPPAHPEGVVVEIETGVPADTLARIGRTLTTVPAGFTLNPKMVQQLARRAKMSEGAAPLDWATAEALAFGAIALEGTPVRLTGQDSARGTFSQRHVVFHDTRTGDTWTPLSELDPKQAPIWIFDSPLSEFAVMGFEYGYSVERPEALVLWEAQYGDFANGAQVIVDQFVSSAEEKWKQPTRLALLLPHGYEGQGPEHSSARIERYLQMCAEDNMQVCNVTTPAQYFHLLRRQVRQERPKPLVLFTPKSLLRLPASFSPLSELVGGSFRAVLEDSEAAEARRVLFCSGKVAYDLLSARAERKAAGIAIVRVEQLYPFPAERLSAMLHGMPQAREFFWVQEEAHNMGSWTFVQPRLEALLPEDARLSYVGREASASPATGNANIHKGELAKILAAAIGSP
jgi:2-oxoglutarate dehydrogenase E1 component